MNLFVSHPKRVAMMPSFIRFSAALLFALVIESMSAAADDHAVFKSIDQGRSWVRSDTGIPQGTRTNAFASLRQTLFAATDSGLFTSVDEAQTWQAVPGLTASTGRIICIATVERKVFVGTYGNGMLMSSDDGESWVRNAAFPAKKVSCLLAQDGKLYAGADTEGVFVSDDEGLSWGDLGQGLPAYSQVFALAIVDGKLFSGLYSKGLFAWNELENRWLKVGQVTPLVLATSGGTLIAGHNPGGLFWSSDLGVSWSKGTSKQFSPPSVFSVDSQELPADAAVWELEANSKRVFAGAAAGIFYSEDHGRTWTRVRAGLPDHSPGIAFLLTRTLVLAGTTIEGAHDQ